MANNLAQLRSHMCLCMLQGGNSRTLMLACLSPADVDIAESLNTLR